MIIKEFDVVIKRYTMDDLKELLGEGRKDIRIAVEWKRDGGLPQKLMSSSMEIIAETWEPKPQKNKL